MKDCTWNDISNTSNFHINDLGFYDSCISNATMKYFMLFSPPSDLTPSVNFKSPSTLAICAPRTCSMESLNRTVAPKFLMVNNSLAQVKIYDIEQILADSHNFDFGSIIFIALTLFFLILGIVSTLKIQKKKNEMNKCHLSPDPKKIEKDLETKLKLNFWKQFDMVSNFKKLTIARVKSPIAQAFDLLRVIAMLFVIMGHSFIIRLPYSINFKDNDSNFRRYISNNVPYGILQNGIYAVSTFFFMGGFVSGLTGVSFAEKAKKLKKSCFSFWSYMMLKRYCRLAPLSIYMTLYYWKIMPMFIKGPSIIEFDQSVPLTWIGFLCNAVMILWTVTYGTCFGAGAMTPWIWYIQCDMKMYLLVPLVVYLTNTKEGILKFFGILAGLSFVISFIVFGVIGVEFASIGFFFVYVQAFFRARIYYVGCAIGAVVYKNKLKKKKIEDLKKKQIFLNSDENAKEKNTKEKKKGKKSGGKLINTLGILALTLTVFVALFYWFHKRFQMPVKDEKNSKIMNGIYCVIAPLLIVASLILFFIKIFSMSPKLVKMVQENRLLQILANISFSMYIFHYTVIVLNFFRFKKYNNLFLRDILASVCCDFGFTCVLGLLGAIFIEIPLGNCWKVFVEKRYFEPAKEKIEEDDQYKEGLIGGVSGNDGEE